MRLAALGNKHISMHLQDCCTALQALNHLVAPAGLLRELPRNPSPRGRTAFGFGGMTRRQEHSTVRYKRRESTHMLAGVFLSARLLQGGSDVMGVVLAEASGERCKKYMRKVSACTYQVILADRARRREPFPTWLEMC